MVASEFKFVTWEPGNKRSERDGSLIRSHCMLGKNKREGSRRSLREARRKALTAAPPRPVVQSFGTSWNGSDHEIRSVSWVSTHAPGPRSTPFLIQVDGEFTRVAANVGKSTQEVLQDLITYKRITQMTYPIENIVDFGARPDGPCSLPQLDDGLFQAVLTVNSAAHDFLQQRPLTDATHRRLATSLHFLKQKLVLKDAYLQDSTLHTVLLHVVVALVFGDRAAITAHMAGLQKIVSLRGGMASLFHEPKLQFKLERLDILWTLGFGGSPYFLTPLPGDSSIAANMGKQAASGNELSSFIGTSDPQLALVFHDLRRLTKVLNEQVRTNQKMSVNEFQRSLNSIQSRALRLERRLDSFIEATLCLAMMAFVLTFFRAPTNPMGYYYLAEQFRERMRQKDTHRPDPSPSMIIWLLVVCGISVCEPSEPWLRELWKNRVKGKPSWTQVQQHLQKVMWIEALHGTDGKAAFEVLTANDSRIA